MSDMKSAQETKEESRSSSDEIPMTFPQRVSVVKTVTRIYDFHRYFGTGVAGLRRRGSMNEGLIVIGLELEVDGFLLLSMNEEVVTDP